MDLTAPIDSLMAASDVGGVYSISENGGALDEDDFFMLLMTELLNQDPLDPMDNTEFIAQLAQLETLNETVDLNENVRTLQMLQATSLVGKQVEAIGPYGEQVEGVVTEVWFVDSETWLTIDDEVTVNIDYVVRIF